MVVEDNNKEEDIGVGPMLVFVVLLVVVVAFVVAVVVVDFVAGL